MGARVAGEAGSVDHLGRSLGELQDLRLVAARFHMRLARPVATLAGKALATFHRSKVRVGIVLQRLHLVGVAKRTGLIACEAYMTCGWRRNYRFGRFGLRQNYLAADSKQKYKYRQIHSAYHALTPRIVLDVLRPKA